MKSGLLCTARNPLCLCVGCWCTCEARSQPQMSPLEMPPTSFRDKLIHWPAAHQLGYPSRRGSPTDPLLSVSLCWHHKHRPPCLAIFLGCGWRDQMARQALPTGSSQACSQNLSIEVYWPHVFVLYLSVSLEHGGRRTHNQDGFVLLFPLNSDTIFHLHLCAL